MVSLTSDEHVFSRDKKKLKIWQEHNLVPVLQDLVDMTSNHGEFVFDSFAGSDAIARAYILRLLNSHYVVSNHIPDYNKHRYSNWLKRLQSTYLSNGRI